jgi:hypothetical protein
MVLFVGVLHPSPMTVAGGTTTAAMAPWTVAGDTKAATMAPWIGADNMTSMAPRAIAPMGLLLAPPPPMELRRSHGWGGAGGRSLAAAVARLS